MRELQPLDAGRALMASIVVPTYNRQELLPEAVASCVEQTWGNIEVVIVDDGSTDGTPELVAEMLGASWPRDRVRYVRQENRGASAARNHGLRLARGAYVQFLDSDDLLEQTKIARQINLLEKPANRSAVCCSCYGRLVAWPEGPTAGTGTRIGVSAASPAALVRELCSRLVHGMPTPAPLWRQAYLAQRSGWREDIALGDDLEYHIRLLVEADQICFIDEELFVVREHTGSRLSADRLTEGSLASFVRTRRAIFSTVHRAGLWDAQVQLAFLGAMRTIYANALQLGNAETIHDLESWLWSLSSTPKRRLGFQSLIVLRRLFGRRFLLRLHGSAKGIRTG